MNRKFTQDDLERLIYNEIRRFKSDSILIFIHYALKDLSNPKSEGHRYLQHGLPPFVAAGIASFAVRFSNPYRNADFGWRELASIEPLVSQYLLADPIGFDDALAEQFYKENPTFLVLRVFASQSTFDYNPSACFAQSLILYNEMIKKIKEKKGIPDFNFHVEFEKIVGTSLTDFIYICFVAHSAAIGNTVGFTRGYFEKARLEGLKIPNDQTTLAVLNNIAATPETFREVYEKRKVQDRRFRAYDFNPLLMYPLIRPWKGHQSSNMDSDRFIAPVPAIIPYRASVGIFYHMFNEHKVVFSNWFGHIFEAYVGEILHRSTNGLKLACEDSVKKTYSQGKIPDFVVVDGTTLIAIEVKGMRFSRPALTTATEEDINLSLKQITKGLRQLDEFGTAVIEKTHGLEDYHSCTDILSVIITHERLPLVNTALFREYINTVDQGQYINQRIMRFPWLILSVQELEILQPHLASGIGVADTIKELMQTSYNETVQRLENTTNKRYKDSFLYQKDLEMLADLGIDMPYGDV